MEFLRKYGVATHIYIPIIKRAVVDFAVSADWTPAAGDVKISKDGAAAANVTNLPTAITMGNTAMWDFSLTATEMQAAKIMVTVADSATKAVEDQMFLIGTYGNASAEHAVDLDDSVRAGLTGIPNAAAGAAGGLLTCTNANELPANAIVAGSIAASALTAAKFAAGAFDAVWTVAIRLLTAGTNIVLAKGVGVTGFNDLDAAGVRGAVGLAAADLDTQLGAINAKTTNLPPDPADQSLIIAATDAIISDTNDIQTRLPAALVGGKMDSTLDAAERAAVSDKLLGRSIAGGADGGRTVRDALRAKRNKQEIAAGVLTVYEEDDVTPAWTAAVTTAAGNPITSIDPA